jgi:hypothetical protein
MSRTAPARGRSTEAVWVLGETTEWLQLPLQPTTSNSAALLTFAHCPNLKLRVPGPHRTIVLACFRRQRLV